jgi:hypothetical protein
MMKLAIVGAGAIGARHLQALARFDGPLLIELVDPVSAARQKASGLLMGVGGLRGEIREVSRVEELSSLPDLAIVATNARERLGAVTKLCAMGCLALILEKVLFTRKDDYAQASKAIDQAGARVWVNCVRRTAPRFHRLQELIDGRPISYNVEGVNWGLASNVIHHLDEWVSLIRAQAVKLTGSFEPGAIPARRHGYMEVLGRLDGAADLSTFTAASRPGLGPGPTGDRTIIIGCEDTTFTIGQTSQDLLIRQGKFVIARESYPVAMQSEATAWHVATILAGGEPSLPRFSAAAQLHLALLDALLPHFQSIDPTLSECPIT